MAAAGALGVVGVDRSATDRRDRLLHEASLVRRIRVQRHLHPGLVGNCETGPDRGGRRAPVLVELESRGPRPQLLEESLARRGVALAEQRDVDGEVVERLEHPSEVPAAGRDRRRPRAFRGTGAAPDERRHAGSERLLDYLGADEVNMAVDAAGGEDEPVPREDLGRRADHEVRVDAVGDVRVPGLADRDDAARGRPRPPSRRPNGRGSQPP